MSNESTSLPICNPVPDRHKSCRYPKDNQRDIEYIAPTLAWLCLRKVYISDVIVRLAVLAVIIAVVRFWLMQENRSFRE
jgi:hypothetical protein